MGQSVVVDVQAAFAYEDLKIEDLLLNAFIFRELKKKRKIKIRDFLGSFSSTFVCVQFQSLETEKVK